MKYRADLDYQRPLIPEETLAAHVILQVEEDLRTLRNYLTSVNFSKRKDLVYGQAKVLKDIRDILAWCWSRSTEEGSILWWASHLSDNPKAIQLNAIRHMQIDKPGPEIKLPKIYKRKYRLGKRAKAA